MKASPRRASWRDWFGLGAMALALFMLSTDNTMLFLAQPSIGADLRPTAAQGLWIVHVGAFLGAGLVITMGRLGDRVGRKRLVIIGMAGYGAASLFAAFAPTAETLIAARALLGAATAAVTPSAMALLRTMFTDSRQFTRAFAIVMAAFSAGVAFGPPMGGLLIEYFWWGAVFLVNVPAAIIFLAIAPWALPEFRDDEPVRLDPPSIVLSVVAIMGVIYGIQQAAEGSPEAQHVVIAVIGLAAGYLFIRRQRRIDQPLLDLTLFNASHVRVTLIALFFVMIASVGPDVLVGPFLQVGLELTALQAGMLLFIPAIASIPATMLAPPLKRHLGVRGGTVLSLSLTATGFVVAALGLLAEQSTTTLVVLIAGLSLVALAGAATTLLSELLVTSAPVQRTGSMSALQDVGSGLGAASGIALLGTLGAIAYRTTLTTPSGLSNADAMAASESPGAAASIANQIADPATRTDFLVSISDSMTLGLQSALVIAAALAIGIIVLLLLGLRGLKPSSDEH
ncbi:MFS transporter [Enemella evansiae]|uniref:MFS transporter n=1 Tax=Enemella evansiae TaxID=2016499 RepID=UPI00106172C0|nr:MFS transporter [Enemella evansiae]TDO92377.1 DHA2 family multidrug resistance protein-like MFS transporter [Enemella evansiae]